MAKLTPKFIAQTLVNHASVVSKAELPKLMKEFVVDLNARGLIHRWRDIEREIHGAWRRKFGAANVTVVSTHPMTRSLMNQVEAIAPGAEVTERIDERLMGGAIIRVDDRRIDGSVAGMLQRLKQNLDRAANG
ncbi:MAG: F0F1 ATP synthase subunit delta [Patescibacteria group bacterium]